MIQLPKILSRFFNQKLAVPSDPTIIRYVQVPGRHAGQYVDHDTALKFSAVYRAIAYISQTIAGLPWDVIRETEKKRIRQPQHPAWQLLRVRPNEEMSCLAWRETMVAWALSWGNGYSEIEFDEAGRPIGLSLISPDRVYVRRGVLNQYGEFQSDVNGQIWYQVFNYGTVPTYLEPERVFHLHGLGYDGLSGYSVISMAARSIGLAQGAESYAEDFFVNGGVAMGGIQTEKPMTDLSYQRLQKWIENQSKPGNKWKWPIFEAGKWVPMAIPSKDAQLLEVREFQVTDIARWFGLPPHKLADLTRATFSNIESQSIEVVNDCFMSWINRLEQEADYKLFSGRERGIRTKINVRGLLRGDDASRAAYYQVMRNLGVYSTNDILRLEDMDEIGPEGDERLVQLNQTTLKRLVAGDVSQNQLPSRQTPERPQESYVLLIEDAYRRILRRESHRYEQSKHRFGDARAFEEWLASSRDDRRVYMRDTLNPIVTSMVIAADPGAMIINFISILNRAIDTHLNRTDEVFIMLNSGQIGSFEVEIRAKDEAKALIEYIFSWISTGENNVTAA